MRKKHLRRVSVTSIFKRAMCNMPFNITPRVKAKISRYNRKSRHFCDRIFSPLCFIQKNRGNQNDQSIVRNSLSLISFKVWRLLRRMNCVMSCSAKIECLLRSPYVHRCLQHLPVMFLFPVGAPQFKRRCKIH